MQTFQIMRHTYIYQQHPLSRRQKRKVLRWRHAGTHTLQLTLTQSGWGFSSEIAYAYSNQNIIGYPARPETTERTHHYILHASPALCPIIRGGYPCELGTCDSQALFIACHFHACFSYLHIYFWFSHVFNYIYGTCVSSGFFSNFINSIIF